MENLRIYIVASTSVARSGLSALLADVDGLRVVGACDGTDLSRDLPHRPHLLLMQLDRLLRLDAPRFVREVKECQPECRALLLASRQAPARLIEGLVAGVDGYLPRDLDRSGLLAGIEGVMRYGLLVGEPFVPGIRQILAARLEGASLTTLTDRELAVVHHLARGCSNREIALAIHISVNTVRSHLRNIYEKMGVGSRVELTALAIRTGLGADVDAPEPTD